MSKPMARALFDLRSTQQEMKRPEGPSAVETLPRKTEASVEQLDDWHGATAVRVRFTDGDCTVYVTGCNYCDSERAAGETFFPHHYASDRCESGKHSHCTCDTCF